jgi:anthranilate phosphoribosyltransferase
MIQEVTQNLSQGRNLTPDQMETVMEEILTGRAQTPQIVSFLTALSQKGETIDEVTAAVLVMRKHAVNITSPDKVVLDTCGTGGDKKGTFNVSTAVAFIASSCGITVAKHGNRSVSSCCGSADILEALGVNINMDKTKIEQCLKDIGIAFLFAQKLHPAMRHAMEARKKIGAKTIFNLLGPLSNPAGARYQLVGVYERRWVEILAKALGNLGARHALVVHGEDGLDELTTVASTFVAEFQHGQIKTYSLSPEDFGLKRACPQDLQGGDAATNAKIILDVFSGKPGPARDIVVLNAAAAIYVADRVTSIKEARRLAEESIDKKGALKKLELLREYSGS